MSEHPVYEQVLRVTSPEVMDGGVRYVEDRRETSEVYAGEEWARRLNKEWAGASSEADYIAPLGVVAGRIASIRGLPRPVVHATQKETALIEEDAGYVGGEL